MNPRRRREFVERLAVENRGFYGTRDGRGVLRAMELPFEHRWIYLFELIQNALDAGARSIAMSVGGDGDSLTFEHDGDDSIDESDVRGISKVFRSTKGASSVGFMGIGFKSVFGRFQEARITGSDWAFRYDVKNVVGREYGDVQPDLLGAVIPIWDDEIAAPTDGFTTRFEFRGLVHPQHDLRSDLTEFLPESDRTPLAILADAGLEHLSVDGKVWELDVDDRSDGKREAVALSGGENLLWQLFPVSYQPSREAIARFLEHRRIQPSEQERARVYAEAGRSRRVLGILPLDDHGVAAPPQRGRVYATLPTDVDLPFGLHINADWLLNISRTGLKEVDDNPWQLDIVRTVADVVAKFLLWVAGTQSEPDAVKAAFKALAAPSQDAGRLEALFADERWLSRLHDWLEEAAVVPTWATSPGSLTFVTPAEAVHPPAALANALEGDVDLSPAVLLGGQVLARPVLGRGGRELLERAGLLKKLAPQDLERTWAGGLEEWWESLGGDESDRRDALFRLWGAVAELSPPPALGSMSRKAGVSSDDAWTSVDLPCVRTATGEWRDVADVTFFREAPPSEQEPGGVKVRDLIQNHLPDAAGCLSFPWMSALGTKSRRETVSGPLSKALKWLEREATSVDLNRTVADAMDALSELSEPDWAVLLHLGHWAMHRNRPDLLTQVLVDSSTGPRVVPIGDALVADPYVERGEVRRHLLPRVPAIAAAYGDEGSASKSAQEWRLFFENAGAQGTLALRPVERWLSQQGRGAASDFLGLDPGPANKNGYTLRDFRVEPRIPDPDAEEDVRRALASWMEDGFSSLANHGRRIATFSYFGRKTAVGSRSSAWLRRLANLRWVPCDDSRLRAPKDVLARSDPARSDAPVSQLSEELVGVLEAEGLEFGSAVPEAPALRRLMAQGSSLGATGLADLLLEVRENVSTEDRVQFAQVVGDLSVPSESGQRFPLNRVVRRAGAGGSLRGAMGGWILPLDGVVEPLRQELLHEDFPHEVPATTTGEQALDYLRCVWKRAGTSGEGLANQVRDVLPAAYAYCLDDCMGDEALARSWQQVSPEAAVFSEREWMHLVDAPAPVYFDDLEDRRFAPRDSAVRTATGGHLGNSRDQQKRTAKALGLPLLSDRVHLRWEESAGREVRDWIPRFELIVGLLAHAREGGRSDGMPDGVGIGLTLRLVERLELWVSVGGSAPDPVPVNARLKEGVLVVAGRPVEFASDAAAELVREFGFRQQANLAVALSGMLGAIGDELDFLLAAEKFSRAFAPDSDLSMFRRSARDVAESTDGESSSPETIRESSQSVRTEATPAERERAPEPEAAGGGSFDVDWALASQRAAAEKLRKALKGELEPGSEEEAEPKSEEAISRDSAADLGDEIYREIAAAYERLFGREPELGDPHQTGWDVRSHDPKTGRTRLIEVKGKGLPWTEDEVVELSRAQVATAFEARNQNGSSWYLYVVERADRESFEVLPISNPADTATKWILRGGEWRLIADEPRQIRNAPGESDSDGK